MYITYNDFLKYTTIVTFREMKSSYGYHFTYDHISTLQEYPIISSSEIKLIDDKLHKLSESLNCFKKKFDATRDFCNDDLLGMTNKSLKDFRITGLLNRASLKLAEIDKISRIIPVHRIAEIVDVCCSPGGFLEYIARKKLWSTRGYAFTLPISEGGIAMHQSVLDKRISVAGMGNGKKRYDFFPIFYINVERVFSEENVTRRKNAMKTDDKMLLVRLKRSLPKVELVLADGSPLKNTPNSKELYNLLVAECNVALICLRKRGNVLVKTFDVSADSETEKYLVNFSNHFETMSIYKPKHSRLTNEERYFFFENFRGKQNRDNLNTNSDLINLNLIRCTNNYLLNLKYQNLDRIVRKLLEKDVETHSDYEHQARCTKFLNYVHELLK